MARPKKTKEPKTIKTTAQDFQRAVSEVGSAKQRAKNASSSKATAASDFCTRSGFSKKAFGIVLQLNDMDDMKRDDIVRQILMGYELMGWGQQKDMFDDIGDRVRDAAKHAEEEDWTKARPHKGSEGLPLEEAEKRFTANAHKAPKPPKAERADKSKPKTDPATAATASKYIDEQAKRFGDADAPTVVFPDPPALPAADAVA